MSRKLRWILPLLLTLTGLRPASAGQDAWTPFGAGEGALQTLTASLRGELYTTATFGTAEIWQLPLPAAGPWRWRNNGLGLPAVTALAVDPKNANSLWAVSGGTGLQSVYHSTDSGGSWSRVSTGDADLGVVHLWVAPQRKSVVLLAETGNGAPRRLLRSLDGGVSWTEVPGALGPVAVPPDEPGVVYAASASAGKPVVVRSENGAKTFRPTGSLPVEASDELRALHATYGRPAAVFASFRNAGLFRSLDGGQGWRRAGFVHAGPAALASEPKAPGTIYAANSIGLYASLQSGRSGSFRVRTTFSLVDLPEPDALVAAPGGPYFLAGSDLYRYVPTPDGFSRVEKTGIESFGLAELRFSPVHPPELVLRRYTGCFRDFCDFRTLFSTDGGATFPLPNGISDATDYAFDPAAFERRLVAFPSGAVLIEGHSRKTFFSPSPVATVEIGAGGILLAGTPEGVQVSEDDGTTWRTALDNAGGGRRIVDLLANPYAPERVIARTLEFIQPPQPRDPGSPVIYHSTDAGRTWTKLLAGSADVEFIPGAPSSLYLLVSTAEGTELRRSDDDGATSHTVHAFPASDGVIDVATDPSASDDLYAASLRGVLQSHDGGATWETTPGDFAPWGAYRQSIGHVQVHPTQRGHLIAAPVEGGLFENQLSH
ncbi:MAG TPA: hypothetical protein VF173_21075 [Thermoanaerobaculia bacterium]|nr:hypothetical protein [Thermoanaerobaculia bacterium]